MDGQWPYFVMTDAAGQGAPQIFSASEAGGDVLIAEVKAMRRSILVCAGLLLMFSTLAVAQTAADTAALTNSDVVKMLKAGLPEGIILRYIQISRTNFATTPNALIDLKKHGASEAVLGAVLDSWSAGGMPYAEALPDGGARFQSSGPSPHMPAFKADLRVNRKVHEQLTMNHNHIELKGKGVPSVSVEWQTSPPER